MNYPSDFPPEAQELVEAAKIRAGRKFDREKQAARWTRDVEKLLVRYILWIFRVFVREAERLHVWRATEMDSACRKFLRELVIEAYYEKGYDHADRPLSRMISHIDGSILPEVQQKFSCSAAWWYFEQARLRVSRPVTIAVAGDLPTQREEAVKTFLRRMSLPLKPKEDFNFTDFWRGAGYTDDTMFQRWKRADPRATGRASRKFAMVLKMTPAEFRKALDDAPPLPS